GQPSVVGRDGEIEAQQVGREVRGAAGHAIRHERDGRATTAELLAELHRQMGPDVSRPFGSPHHRNGPDSLAGARYCAAVRPGNRKWFWRTRPTNSAGEARKNRDRLQESIGAKYR